MAGLTKKEILDQLKKLGINSTSELKSYFREYRNYYNLRAHSRSQQQYHGGAEGIHPKQGTLANRFARVYNSIISSNR